MKQRKCAVRSSSNNGRRNPFLTVPATQKEKEGVSFHDGEVEENHVLSAAGRQKSDSLRYCPDGGVNLITRRQRLPPSRHFLIFEFVRPFIQLLRGPEANDYNIRVCRNKQSKAS
jgi:hypothetical protein